MKAAVVAVGDEIVSGRVEDTNTPFLTSRLRGLGAEVVLTVTVKDEAHRIRSALSCARACADTVVVSGGLGPTSDDLTMAAAADFFERPLKTDEGALQMIRERFRSLGLECTRNNEKQALFPEGTEVLPNPVGTAPGCRADSGGTVFYFLPGVPVEFELMVREAVLPRLGGEGASLGAVAEGRLHLFGITESKLGETITGLRLEEAVEVSYRAVFPENHLGLTVRGADGDVARRTLARAEASVRRALGAYIYGEGETSHEAALGAILLEKGMDVAVAETFTGGLLQGRLSGAPESERVLRGGIVALGMEISELVDLEDGSAWNGRSAPPEAERFAVEVAKAVRERCCAAVGLALLGGPWAAEETKETVIDIGLALDGTTSGSRYRFKVDLERAKPLGAALALESLRRNLLGIDRLPWQERLMIS